MSPRDQVERFIRDVALPAFEGIRATLDADGKTTGGHYGGTVMDENVEDLLAAMRPSMLGADSLKDGDPGPVHGPSLVVYDPQVQTHEGSDDGIFLQVLIIWVEDGQPTAAPWCIYQMRCDGGLHQFPHRFRAERAREPLADLTRQDLENAFLRAFTYFTQNAGALERPAGL